MPPRRAASARRCGRRASAVRLRTPDLAAKAAIVGIEGPVLLQREATLFKACPPAGVILFARNIEEPGQLARLIVAMREVLPTEADILVDQEGGRVARLRPPHWRAHPPAAALGRLFEHHPGSGLRAAWLTGALIGLDCRRAGFTVAATPVLDLSVPGAHDVIGDRAFARHPVAVARLGRAVANGLLAAGIMPIGKHAPGHGRARVDSHLALPQVPDADLEADFRPFALNGDLPWLMTAHIVYPALDPRAAATMSSIAIRDVIRGRIGFEGVLVTDDLAMKALSGGPADLAAGALAAGCDVALYCSGDFRENQALLTACPPLTSLAQARLQAGRTRLAACRMTLAEAPLADERARILS